ncbi:conserved protein of unknown function [Paraburkholderia dioscoreae]|uniref:Uncharacterized protein n=2 Tax=Paraburkholderia dioscoreae TaxID=2604047 RepID=A0A5Q4ZMP4_9BURK|nr:conserved protein of unknown function [Paraburkholderia dioscoreae]
MAMNEFEANLARFRAQFDAPESADARTLLNRYSYLPELTAKLDNRAKGTGVGRLELYEMVLWKLSRFPHIDDELLARIGEVDSIEPGKHRDAKCLLAELLRCKGVRLPVASTLLRFANPETFQVIDERALRVLLPNDRVPAPVPGSRSKAYLVRCCELYFRYLDELRTICSEALPFRLADRALYQLDKELGNKIGKRASDEGE